MKVLLLALSLLPSPARADNVRATTPTLVPPMLAGRGLLTGPHLEIRPPNCQASFPD